MGSLILSIILGGVLAYGLGVPWYMALSRPWMAAAGLKDSDMQGSSQGLLYASAFAAWLVSSAVLNLAVFPLLAAEAGLGRILGLTVSLWLAFAMLSTLLSTMFGMRGRALLWIDGGYTLLGSLLIALVHHFIA